MTKKLIVAEPVSAYDAKTHLPKLLERAERGERFVITRHGRPVAQLIPVESGPREGVQQALKRVATLRGTLARGGVTLADVCNDEASARRLAHVGHRY
jgi:prevent-host-death family protein